VVTATLGVDPGVPIEVLLRRKHFDAAYRVNAVPFMTM